jgi:hypothetical protein
LRGSSIKDGDARGLWNLYGGVGNYVISVSGAANATIRPYSDQLADDCSEYRPQTSMWIPADALNPARVVNQRRTASRRIFPDRNLSRQL